VAVAIVVKTSGRPVDDYVHFLYAAGMILGPIPQAQKRKGLPAMGSPSFAALLGEDAIGSIVLLLVF